MEVRNDSAERVERTLAVLCFNQRNVDLLALNQ
jgi:hypothetical protein